MKENEDDSGVDNSNSDLVASTLSPCIQPELESHQSLTSSGQSGKKKKITYQSPLTHNISMTIYLQDAAEGPHWSRDEYNLFRVREDTLNWPTCSSLTSGA